ncbi:hypothetical protein DMB38_11980 [Streptomyces sp. WAC 06738]|uniref:hypothetical protein n=1 Tax=Streptomyces sp. WAC 06738 TaxID=2203210 RepID=UPI000F71DD45|nr:hypothetical protein [Streptomyces sp. WAC 06738]AZM46444.1 hypothetical protein DMB38_11980 [Streptomyces sp. WAC 06738]
MTVLAAVSAAALALAGCSDDDSDSSAADQESSQEAAPEPEEEPAAAEEESPAAAPKEVEVTPPGTKLKIGEQAVVPYDRAGATGHIGITVTGVSDVDKAAFDAALGENGDADITPYCVEFTVENADGSDLGGSYPPDLVGTTADGGDPGATVFGADVEGCAEGQAPDEFAEAGASYETKRLQGAGPGASVAGASYKEDDYEDAPIVWTP